LSAGNSTGVFNDWLNSDSGSSLVASFVLSHLAGPDLIGVGTVELLLRLLSLGELVQEDEVDSKEDNDEDWGEAVMFLSMVLSVTLVVLSVVSSLILLRGSKDGLFLFLSIKWGTSKDARWEFLGVLNGVASSFDSA